MKTTKEMIEVMQAYIRGERIECFNDEQWKDVKNPVWDWLHNDYQVKPKRMFLPLEKAEDFLEAQRKHGVFIKRIKDGVLFCSYVYYTGRVLLEDSKGDTDSTHIGDLYGKYVFEDGTPCGKEVKL